MSRKSNFRLYRVWDGIIQRCCNPNAKNYRNYGGRGIRICNEWRENFSAHLITFLGETLCAADWCERFGISGSTLWRRLKSGWSIEDALTKPKQKRTKKMNGGDSNAVD